MHSPALSQMPQSTGWLSVMNCRMALRCAFTSSESVKTFMPALTGMLQAMSSPRPSTSTRHMRQLPAIESCGCQQKFGMKCAVRERDLQHGLVRARLDGLPVYEDLRHSRFPSNRERLCSM